MAMIRHAVHRAEYRRLEDGTVKVSWPDGESGIFDRDGKWIAGRRRAADPALCFWVVAASDNERPGTLAAAGNRQDEVAGGSQ